VPFWALQVGGCFFLLLVGAEKLWREYLTTTALVPKKTEAKTPKVTIEKSCMLRLTAGWIFISMAL